MTHAYFYFSTLLAARTLLVAICLIVGFRLLGKRQIGQMNVYDLAMVMAVANGVQNAMTSGKGDLSVGIVCAGTLLLFGRVISMIFVRWTKLEHALAGMPTVMIIDGKMNLAHMKRERVTEDELMAALRMHGLCDPDEAKLAVLEVDGSLSIVPRDAAEPALPLQN